MVRPPRQALLESEPEGYLGVEDGASKITIKRRHLRIKGLRGREILDSRGYPTVEVEMFLDNDQHVWASVPSGRSVGKSEVAELRDQDQARYAGQGVLKAVKHINEVLPKVLVGMDVNDPFKIDRAMLGIDVSSDKSRLGGNVMIGVSIAALKASALANNIPVYRRVAELSGNKRPLIPPIPMFNVINGGAHADNNLTIQEFMIVPALPESFKERLRQAVEAYYNLKSILHNNGYSTNVGDEGGFAPSLSSDREAIDFLVQSGKNIKIAFDFAGHQIKSLSYADLINQYPVVSLEDPLPEDDIEGWRNLRSSIGQRVMLVGDDLFTTNPGRLQSGIIQNLANAVIVKPNQIGTLVETFDFVKAARTAGFKMIVSHRSGETEDSFIADMAVGVGANFVKFGAPARGERVAKYNRLLRIEEELLTVD